MTSKDKKIEKMRCEFKKDTINTNTASILEHLIELRQ